MNKSVESLKNILKVLCQSLTSTRSASSFSRMMILILSISNTEGEESLTVTHITLITHLQYSIQLRLKELIRIIRPLQLQEMTEAVEDATGRKVLQVSDQS